MEIFKKLQVKQTGNSNMHLLGLIYKDYIECDIEYTEH